MLGMKMTFKVGNVVQVDWSFFDLVKPSIQSFCIVEFPYFFIFSIPMSLTFNCFLLSPASVSFSPFLSKICGSGGGNGWWVLRCIKGNKNMCRWPSLR